MSLFNSVDKILRWQASWPHTACQSQGLQGSTQYLGLICHLFVADPYKPMTTTAMTPLTSTAPHKQTHPQGKKASQECIWQSIKQLDIKLGT